jgi:hypothetical protein
MWCACMVCVDVDPLFDPQVHATVVRAAAVSPYVVITTARGVFVGYATSRPALCKS